MDEDIPANLCNANIYFQGGFDMNYPTGHGWSESKVTKNGMFWATSLSFSIPDHFLIGELSTLLRQLPEAQIYDHQ